MWILNGRAMRHSILGLLASLLLQVAWAGEPAEAAVRQVLMAEFDKPDARLEVAPVVVSGAVSVASWTQGTRGGRALLFQKDGQWRIALCSGDALKGAQFLQQAGVDKRQAVALSKALAEAEARLTAAQRAKFSSFDGTVRLDAAGQHPPGHKH